MSVRFESLDLLVVLSAGLGSVFLLVTCLSWLQAGFPKNNLKIGPTPSFSERLRCWCDARNSSTGEEFEANTQSASSGAWERGPYLFESGDKFYGEVSWRTEPLLNRSWRWKQPGWCFPAPLPATREDACNLLNGRDLLVVGDSLNEEVFDTLGNFLAETPEEFDTPYQRWGFNNVTLCRGTLGAHFVRNDRLSLVVETVISPASNFYEFPWVPWVQTRARQNSGSSIVILLNRGAHYESDAAVLAAIEAALTFVEQEAPGAVVMWRTTPHGQVDISNFNAPPLTPSEYAPDLDSMPYDWGHFPAQNQLVLEMLRSRFPRVVLLDLAPVIVLRSDSHQDGLHYGIPGPLDVVVETLMRFLPEILASTISLKIR